MRAIQLIIKDKDSVKTEAIGIDLLPEYISFLKNFFSGGLLPYNTLNSTLRKGSISEGCYRVLEWQPFEISEQEYNQIKALYEK